MESTGIAHEHEALLQAVTKITASPVLHNSEALCKLLRYLAQQVVDPSNPPPKEYQIAIEVFGRPPDFDARLDSTVRVQTGRLRSKLAEYYAGPGSEDDLLIDIPKGSYFLSFHRRNASPAAPAEPAAAALHPGAIDTSGATHQAQRMVRKRWFFLLLVPALASVGFYGWWRLHTRSAMGQPLDPTRAFWQVFITGKQPPLVIFGNAEFVGSPTLSMRYFNPATDSRLAIRDTYTGIGEVFAVHQLDQIFARFGSEIRIKRGRQLAWDDTKDRDLIFLGSTIENLSLRELPEGRDDFVFKQADGPPRNGDWEILNLRPQPGEEPFYVSSASLPTTEDYALIALLPAMEAGHWVMILAGTTTWGTQAAAEYVCRPDALQDLINRLHLSDPAHPVPFEGVIKTEINGGVPLRTGIVALHIRSQPRPQ